MRRSHFIAVIGLAAALAFVATSATGASSFTIRLVSQTSSTITLGWDAQPGYGYLFTAGGTLVSRTNDPSRTSVRFSKVPSGQYDIDVIVKGANGHYPITTTDTIPPSVSVTAPANGATVSGTISETATASDNVGVTRVEFLRDGTLYATDTTTPYSASFDTTTVTNGSHTLGARAFDAANNVGTATNVTVTVSNIAPPTPQCSDGVDNTDPEDTLIDYPADPGCTSATDNDETDPVVTTGFPDSSNTGVPAGTTLTAYTGPSNITTPNTVIDSKTIGCIQVSASGVVIRNSRITCASGAAVYVDDRSFTDTATPLLLEDVEINCQNSNTTGVGEADVTVRRANIHGCENGFDINQNMLIEDSYIHDLYNGGGAHMDGAQLASGHWNGSSYPCCALNVTIRHNTIYAVDPAGAFGTSAIISNSGGDVNVLIEHNLMAGGAFTLYCEQHAKGTNYRVIDNHFSTRFKSTVGFFGPSTDCSDEVQSGNVIHETGQPITLG